MRRFSLIVTLALVLVTAGVLPAAATHPASALSQPDFADARVAPTLPHGCQEGVLPGGALSLICVPTTGWNGDLLIWAHGYVAFNEPLAFYNLYLGETYLPDLVQSLGYAFATTSYRTNGLAIVSGVDDVVELIAAFPGVAGQAPTHTYMSGASEGGIVTALMAERHPELLTGALSACGPIGDFKKQTDYLGDFRVLFDYFFPAVLPPSPIAIPPAVIDNWQTTYVPAITQQVRANPRLALQLMSTSRAATQLFSMSSMISTTVNVLWYNAFATNDAREKLGGNPFGNRTRIYRGSLNDPLLNQRVQRFRAAPVALAALNAYQTTGRLTVPMVTLHTTGDEVIPFWHQFLYRDKVQTSGRGQLVQMPIFRYGHCNFTGDEALAAFAILIFISTGEAIPGLPEHFDPAQIERDFQQAARLTDAVHPPD